MWSRIRRRLCFTPVYALLTHTFFSLAMGALAMNCAWGSDRADRAERRIISDIQRSQAIGLKIEAFLTRPIIRKGQAVSIGVRLRNVGSVPMIISQYISQNWNVRIVLLNSTGKQVPYKDEKLMKCGSPQSREELMVLNPGYSYINAKVDDNHIRPAKAGKYTLIVTYSAIPVDSSVAGTIWTGSTQSLPISVEVR